MKIAIALLILLIPFTSFKKKDKNPPHKDVIAECYSGKVKRAICKNYSRAIIDSISGDTTGYSAFDSTLVEFDENGFFTRTLVYREEGGDLKYHKDERWHYEPGYKKATIDVYVLDEKIFTSYLTWVDNNLKIIRTYNNDSLLLEIDSVHYNKDYRRDTVSKKYFDLDNNFQQEVLILTEYDVYGSVQTMIHETFEDPNRKNLLQMLVQTANVIKRDKMNNPTKIESKVLGDGIKETVKTIQTLEYYD